MNYPTFLLINGPLVILNIAANAFYLFCMLCPLHRERIKQPLKLLLGSLICSAIPYVMSICAMVFSGILVESYNLTQISYLVWIWSLSTSMTSSVWLNFFYYTQIVPAQRALFIWIKKNIKPIIYCIWLVERIYSLLDFTVMVVDSIPFDGFGFSNNFTMDHDIHMPARAFLKWLEDMYIVLVCTVRAHFFICLCVMVMSSGSTVVYLCRHMRRMVANGQTFSCPRFRAQVRATLTGIIQGVLYVFCAVWTVYRSNERVPSPFFSIYAHFTVINLYMSGTTFNLGAGQAVFRQKAANIWLRAAQCCKAPKAQQSKQGG